MLQLILGRAGYGKTKYVFDSIKELVSNGEENVLFLTPEQNSFSTERRLLKELGEEKVNCVEYSSFSRLSNDISRLYGGDSLPILSSGSKAVLMKKAIEMVQDNLVIFDKSTTSPSFINSIISVYDEMKSCRVSVDDIIGVSDCTEKEVLKDKLIDISAIIGAYDSLIEGIYIDPANKLTKLYERLLDLDYFCNRTIYIDGFNGFVAQEYKIIEIMLKQAKNVYITFCTDSDKNNDKYDLFSYVNSNISILYDVARKNNVKILDSVVLEKPYRFNNLELESIEKYAFNTITCESELEAVNNVSIYKARSISDECDHMSQNISNLFRQGIRASQIAVICRDYDKYQKEIEFSFKKYDIPYFDDERQSITSQPVIMLVNFLLRTAIYSLRSEDIFSLLKTGLTTLDNDRINELENYVYMWNINGSKWKTDFVNSTKGLVEKISPSDQAKLDNINESRSYIINKLVKFKSTTSSRSVKDICKAVYFTIIDLGADKKLKELAISLSNNGKSALAQEQGRVWDLLMQILNDLATVSDNEHVSLNEFYNLFNIMLSYEDLGTLPTGLDNIQVGSADRIRCDNPYAVFVLGANEGEFPQIVKSAGLLTESDRVTLINNNFKLYSYGETLNAQEKYFAYMAMSSASDKLYISYRNGKDDNDKSTIVTSVLKALPLIKETTFNDTLCIEKLVSDNNSFDQLVSHFDDNTELSESLKEYFKSIDGYQGKVRAVEALKTNREISINDTSVSTELFGKDMYLSASKIEEYHNCAFKYFCKFGLKAKPRTKVKMDPMQTGTVIHYVLEQIIKNNPKNSFVELSDSAISIEVDKYLKDYLNNKIQASQQLDKRFNYQFMRLSKMLIFVVLRLRDEFKESDFEAKAFELKIGLEDEIVPTPVALKDGGSITINGSIDRVDTYTEGSKQYVRVVDYKSGIKTFDLSDILYGLNLQMFIYMFSLCNSNHPLSGISSGVLYMHAAREVYSLSSRGDESNISAEDKKSFKMKGVFLDDDDNSIIPHMEKNLGRYGKFIDVNQTKAGYSGNIVSLAQLGMISKKIFKLIEAMGEDLHNGQINQNPVEGGHHSEICSYCDYIDICKNRKEITLRQCESLSNEAVLSILEEEEGA